MFRGRKLILIFYFANVYILFIFKPSAVRNNLGNQNLEHLIFAAMLHENMIECINLKVIYLLIFYFENSIS